MSSEGTGETVQNSAHSKRFRRGCTAGSPVDERSVKSAWESRQS